MDEQGKFTRKNEFEESQQLLKELQNFFEWHPGKNHMYYFAHKHRLTFYHQKKPDDDNKVSCVACKQAIEYGNAVYCCPKCPTIWLHKLCAEWPQEIEKHPFHTQHPLKIQENNEYRSRRCSGCELPLGQGVFYGCKDQEGKDFPCEDVFFHKSCLELPREIKHSSHPYHPLSLKQESEKFRCEVCSGDHNGLNYSCESCDYNLGIRCIINKDTKRSGNPLGHVLTFHGKRPSECGESVCLVCRRRFNLQQPVFHCKECKFSLHRHCVLPVALPLLPDTFPSKKHSEKHPAHPLTLTNYLDPDIWPQVCDVCNEFIPTYSSFYYCKHCDFAEDLTCVLSERRSSIAHKVDYYVEQLDIVPIVIKNPSLTVEDIIESFTQKDMEELNKVVEDAFSENVGARRKLINDQQDGGNKVAMYSDQPFGQILA